MEQVIDATREMLAGPTLATSVLKDPQIFYFACGMQLTLGELQEFDELLPNPFGGEPFPGSSQLLLESVDEAANRAVVIHRLQLDPEEARRVMLETFIKLAADTGSPTPRASDLPDFSIVDESEYDLDLVTNLPRSLTHVRTVSAAGSSQIDRLAFRILPPPAESTDEAAGEDE